MADFTREASRPHASDWEAQDIPNNDHPWGRDVHRDIEYRGPAGNTQRESLDGLSQNEADVLADIQHEW
jgi:hypothetical protein